MIFGKKKNKTTTTVTTAAVLPPEVENTPIYTMPEKFLPVVENKPKSGRGFIWLIYGIVFLVVIGIGLTVWFFLYTEGSKPDQTQSEVVNINIPPPAGEQADQPAEVKPPVIVKFTAKDANGEEIGSVTITFAAEDSDIADSLQVFSLLPEQTQGKSRQAIGAIYSFVVPDMDEVVFTKPAKFEFSYLEPPNLTSQQENSLRLAKEISPNKWEFIEEAKLDIVDNKISIEFSSLPKEKITILSNLVESDSDLDNQNKNNNQPNNITEEEVEPEVEMPLQSSVDSDSDGLTDKEEFLYNSSINNSDTDGDGYPDGTEVLNFYSPISTSTLLQDGLVKLFENDNIRFMYPSSWEVSTKTVEDSGDAFSILYPTDQGEGIGSIIIQTDQTDFIQIYSQDNPDNLSAKEWYLQLVPDISAGKIREEEVGPYKGVRSLDNSTFYLAIDDKIYVFVYGSGLKNRVDYLTTWQMIYRSFEVK